MQKSSLEFLERLVEAPGPSGSERPVQEVYEAYVRSYADEIVRSVHGSVAAIRNPEGTPRVVIAGHADEIALIVHHIDEKGFISFRAIGGVDLLTLPGTVVEVHAKSGVAHGVIGRKPLHLQSGDERHKVEKITQLSIDIGAGSKSKAEKVVRPGDRVTFRRGLLQLGKDFVSSKALDDRAGVFCAAECLRLLAGKDPDACVVALSTVCEEIGGDGARTAAFDLRPDVALVVDVTFATDQPEVSAADVSEVHLGKGPVIARGPRLSEPVVRHLEAAAKRAKIAVQYEVLSNRTGTDGDLFFKSRGGVPVGLVSAPCRYMHSPAEVVCVRDLEALSQLLAAAAAGIGAGDKFSAFS